MTDFLFFLLPPFLCLYFYCFLVSLWTRGFFCVHCDSPLVQHSFYSAHCLHLAIGSLSGWTLWCPGPCPPSSTATCFRWHTCSWLCVHLLSPLPAPFSQGLWRVIFRVQAVGRGRAAGHLPMRPSAGGSGQTPVHRALPSFLHICTSLSQGEPASYNSLMVTDFF